jgi:DNA polymerase-3 subunit epsilon
LSSLPGFWFFEFGAWGLKEKAEINISPSIIPHMNLNLKKPIVFLDIETTGTNIVTDRIVEISLLKVFPDGQEIIRTYRVNPAVPIPKTATDIHGITDDDVKDEPLFREIAKAIGQFIEGCDIAGYNSNMFDIPLLAEEFLRAEVDFDKKNHRFIDVQVIFHKMEQRTLSAAYRFYCGKELTGAHGAETDTRATFEVLKSQLGFYTSLDNNVEYLSAFSSYNESADLVGRIIYDDKGVEVFNFGKHKGIPVEKVLKKEPSYYSWMMNNEFPLYTKKILTQIKLREISKNTGLQESQPVET